MRESRWRLLTAVLLAAVAVGGALYTVQSIVAEQVAEDRDRLRGEVTDLQGQLDAIIDAIEAGDLDEVRVIVEQSRSGRSGRSESPSERPTSDPSPSPSRSPAPSPEPTPAPSPTPEPSPSPSPLVCTALGCVYPPPGGSP